MTTHRHQMPRSRMRGAIPLHPPWSGDQLSTGTTLPSRRGDMAWSYERICGENFGENFMAYFMELSRRSSATLKKAQIRGSMINVVDCSRDTTILRTECQSDALGCCYTTRLDSLTVEELMVTIYTPPPWFYSPWRTLASSHIEGFLSYLERW
jgi:hypothetical protein